MRRLGHKPILAITAMVAAATAVTFAASPAAQADIETHSGSVDLSSLPGSAPVVIDQFDPSLGTLTQLTVTATLAGSIAVDGGEPLVGREQLDAGVHRIRRRRRPWRRSPCT